MNFRTISDSSRVILPSLFASIASKKPANCFPPSSREIAPSLSLSICLSMSSNDGILFFGSGSSAPPGDQPAKSSVPSAVIGDEQQPDGIPPKYQRSSPVFGS